MIWKVFLIFLVLETRSLRRCGRFYTYEFYMLKFYGILSFVLQLKMLMYRITFISVFVLFFEDTVSIYSFGRPRAHYEDQDGLQFITLASWMVELKAWTTIPSYISFHNLLHWNLMQLKWSPKFRLLRKIIILCNHISTMCINMKSHRAQFTFSDQCNNY